MNTGNSTEVTHSTKQHENDLQLELTGHNVDSYRTLSSSLTTHYWSLKNTSTEIKQKKWKKMAVLGMVTAAIYPHCANGGRDSKHALGEYSRRSWGVDHCRTLQGMMN